MAVMGVGSHGFDFGWGAAAVCGLTASRLKLDRGMGDVETVAQRTVDAIEDAAAL